MHELESKVKTVEQSRATTQATLDSTLAELKTLKQTHKANIVAK